MLDAPIRRPQLDELETFLLAARLGSLTRAAEVLRVSKTAAAKRLDRLEALVGRRLLERGPRGARLTEEGRRLAPRAEELLRTSDEVLGRVADLRAGIDRRRISGLRSLSGSAALSTERVLDTTEQLFGTVFHAVQDGIAILSPGDWVILEANDGFARALGHARDDLLGRAGPELGLVPQATHEAVMAEVAAEGGIESGRMAFRAGTGETRVAEFSITPIDVGGAPLLLCVGRDVTERVRDEQSLQRQAAQQRAVADLTLAALGGESASSVYARSAELLAAHLAAPVAAVWEEVAEGRVELRSVHGIELEAARAAAPRAGILFRDAAAGGELLADDIARDRRFAGTLVEQMGMRSVAVTRIALPGAEPYGYAAAARREPGGFGEAGLDFLRTVARVLAMVVREERLTDADALRGRQLENLAALVDASTDPSGMLSLEGELVYLNPAARRLLGLRQDARLAGRSVFDAVDARAAARFRDRILPEVRRTGGWRGQLTLGSGPQRMRGRVRLFLVNDPVTRKPGNIVGIFRPAPAAAAARPGRGTARRPRA